MILTLLGRKTESRTNSIFQGPTLFSGINGWGGKGLPYSTVTDLARLRGWSMSVPFSTAMW